MHGDEEMELGRENRLDAAIDGALRNYAEPEEITEARVVLARVMERAHASESQRKALWIWGGLAAAGLAAMVLVGLAWVLQGPRRAEIAWAPKAPGVVQSVPQRRDVDGARWVEQVRRQAIPAENAAAKARSDLRSASAPVRLRLAARGLAQGRLLKSCPDTKTCWHGAPPALPKMAVFPTPRPLGTQEKALVAFARRAPQEVKKAVIEDQQHWDDPIVVADLQKPSLQSGSQQDQ